MGQSVTVKRDVYSFVISIPEAEDEYKYSKITVPPRDDDRDPPPSSVSFVQSPSDSFITLRIIKILLNFKADISVATYVEGRDEPTLQMVFMTMWEHANSVAREFMDFVRIDSNQYWIEPNGRLPRVLNIVELIDATDEPPWKLGFAIGLASGSFRAIDGTEIMDQPKLDAIGQAMQDGRGLHAGELLVNEARYIFDSEQVTAPERSTLVGAMGVEVFTKYVLRTIASPAQLPLVELLLENPRDWSMAAHGLFLKGLEQIAQRDLGQSHKDMSKRVAKLFEARNRVVHRGEAVDRADARIHVQTAVEAMAFLREILAEEASNPSTQADR